MSPDWQGAQAWEMATTWWLTPYTAAFAARQGQEKEQDKTGNCSAGGTQTVQTTAPSGRKVSCGEERRNSGRWQASGRQHR
jgi:hypothetical protein